MHNNSSPLIDDAVPTPTGTPVPLQDPPVLSPVAPPEPPAAPAPPAALSPLASVGIDVGGTKTHLLVEREDGTRDELVIPSARWRSDSLFSTTANLERLAATVLDCGTVTDRTSVAAGMHGVDNPAQVQTATSALVGALGIPLVTVVNDAELLGHAVGTEPSVQMIVGTGAVVVGHDADDRRVSAFGYGWMLSDFGSAPGLVREAMRELLRRADRSELADDPLPAMLLAEFGVSDVTELALAMSDGAGLTAWGRLAPLVFAAADAGSPIALLVIDDAAAHLADGVAAVVRRGALGTVVAAAGGVIVNQPRLQDAVRSALATAAPTMRLVVLSGPPVEGALALARSRAAEVAR